MRTRKWTIADWMWLVLVMGLGFSLARWSRTHDQYEAFAACWIALVLVPPVFQWAWFIAVPSWVIPRLSRGDADRQRRLLGVVVATPAMADGMKALARYLLLVAYQVDRRFAEAEAQARAILGSKGLLPAFESSVRLRLADCLEGLDRRPEADAERALADEVLKGTKETYLGRLAQGKLFERENRHAEAYRAYERGLELVPAGQKGVRSEFMMHLVLTSFNAGRPDDTIRWAEQVLASDPRGPHTGAAHRMAAVALGNLGRNAEAERHARDAVGLTEIPKKRAEALALVASYVYRSGALDEAERLCLELESACPDATRHGRVVLAEVQRLRGDFEGAIASIETARAADPLFIPASERRVAAALAKQLASLLAEVGRLDEALAQVREADAEVRTDPKLGVQADAVAALVHALRGDADEARARLASAAARRREVSGDRTTQFMALMNLARASLALDDPQQAEQFLREYLELEPIPVNRPACLYHLADCRRRLGDAEGGRALDLEAASTSFGTRHERLARDRLAAEAATTV